MKSGKKKPEAATSGLKKFRRYINNRNKLNDVIRDLVLHHFPVICKTGGKKFYIWFGFNADNVALMFVSAGDVGGARDIAATLVNNWGINNVVEKQRKNTDIAKMGKKRV